MIIECPRCNARYRIEDEILREEPTFKCSRCSHLFAYEVVDDPPPAAPETAVGAAEARRTAPPPVDKLERRAAPDEAQSMSFPFASGALRAGRDRLAPATSSASAAGVSAGPVQPAGNEESAESDFELGDDEAEFEVGVEPEVDDGPRFMRAERATPGPESEERSPLRPYLAFLGALLFACATASLYLRNHPEAAERLVARVPILGRYLTENRLLQTRIYLRSLEGVYQEIKDGKRVFIVSGRALNTSGGPVKSVEIEGVLYDQGGEPIARKNIYCGNIMSLKIVKDLSSQEISLLQRLRPPVRFEIRSGEEAGFSVVFLDPPPDLGEFSAQVVAAQPVLL